MQAFAKEPFARDSWQTPRNARTLAAYMALRNSEIGARISALRKDRGGMPQEIVAQKLGVSNRSYQAWEAGDTKPSWRNLEKLAKFYGVTEEYILLGSELVQRSTSAESQLDQIERAVEVLTDRVEALTLEVRQQLEATQPPLNASRHRRSA